MPEPAVRDLFSEAVEKTFGQELYAEKAGAMALVDEAKAFEILDLSSYQHAQALVKDCKDAVRRAQARWKDAKESAYKAWKSITETLSAFTDPLDEAARILGNKAYNWKREQEEIAKENERKRQEAERKRIEDERLAQAERLEKQGETGKADAVLSAPIEVAPKAIETPPKDERISYRENWVCSIEDANLIPREYMVPDLTKINKVVKALKGETRIPGVRVWDAGSTVVKKDR